MGIFIGYPGGIVVISFGISGFEKRISEGLVPKRNESKSRLSPLWAI